MGDEYRASLGFGGRGNDIINLPGSFDDSTSTVKVYGGLGDDQLLAPAEVGDGGDTVMLFGGEGNDKIEGIALVTTEQKLYGGAGDDKIIAADGQTADHYMEGNDGNDIIYGAVDGANETIFGDFPAATITSDENGIPILGGNDKIYGSDNLTAAQTIAGGTYDDWIWSGTNIMGAVKIYGDNDSTTPLTEDSSALNINDGEDIIYIGNDNTLVYGWGQGGNDKMIGGFGAAQIEKLYGGSGDDKIWLVNPE